MQITLKSADTGIIMFEITNENFIHTVKVVPDYSKHYQCFFDRENG